MSSPNPGASLGIPGLFHWGTFSSRMSQFFAAYGTEVPPLSAEACLYQPLGIPAAFEQRDCGIPWNQRWKGITHGSTNAIFSVPGPSRILWPKMAQRIATKRVHVTAGGPLPQQPGSWLKQSWVPCGRPVGLGIYSLSKGGWNQQDCGVNEQKPDWIREKLNMSKLLTYQSGSGMTKSTKMIIFEQLAVMGPY